MRVIQIAGCAVLLTAMAAPSRVACAIGQTSTRPQVEAHFRAGQRAMSEGRPEQAVQEFQQVLQLDPGLSEARINLGLAYHLVGDYRRALTELEKGLQQNPNALGANVVLGVDELKLGSPARAIRALKRALRLDPSNQEALGTLAAAYIAQQNFLEANRAYRAAFLAARDHADGWFRLGQAYLQISSLLAARVSQKYQDTAWGLRLAGDLLSARHLWSDATRKYQQALARDPNQVGLHASLGNALLQQGKLPKAEQEFQNELRVDPASEEALGGLAEIRRQKGEAAEPHPAELAKQIKGGLDGADSLMVGKARFALEQYDQASDAFALALARNNASPEVTYWLVRTYLKLADDCFSHLATTFPNSPQVHALQAETYRARGADQEAIEEFRRAVSVQPDNASLHEALGELLLKKHELSEADHELKKALELEPRRARSLYLMGRVDLGRREAQKAIGLLEKALEIEPSLLEARASLGMAYLRAGKPALAVPQLEQAESLDYYGDLHYMLSQAYRGIGREDRARNALAKSEALRRRTQALDEAKVRSTEGDR